MTIARRVESKLYVTLWFIIGTSMWMPLLYAIGNVVWNPPTGALTGINDAIWNWFYGHNVLGLWFTTGHARRLLLPAAQGGRTRPCTA